MKYRRKARRNPKKLCSETVARALWTEWGEYDRRMLLGEVHALAKRQELEPGPLSDVVALRERSWSQIPGAWRYLIRVWLTSWEGP